MPILPFKSSLPVRNAARRAAKSLAARCMFEPLESRQYLSAVTIDASNTADEQWSTAFLVANHSGPLSLRNALTLAQFDASQGQTVTVQLGTGLTYKPTFQPFNEFGALVTGQPGTLSAGSVTIEGNNSTIDLSNDTSIQLLQISGSAAVTINQLTIANSRTSGSGTLSVTGTATLAASEVSFTNDSVTGFTGGGASLTHGDAAGGDGRGGAVDIGTSGLVSFFDCNFTNDTATGGAGQSAGTYNAQGGNGLGGAVAVDNLARATVSFTDSTFTSNTVYGGATASTGNGFDPNDTASFNGVDPNSSSFHYGIAEGGAIYIGAANSVTFNNTQLAHNQAIGRHGNYGFGNDGANGEDGGVAAGGAIYANSANVITFTNGELVSNSVTGGQGGDQTHTDTQAGKGGAGLGGAIYAYSSEIDMTGAAVSNNTAIGGATGGTKSGVHQDNGNNSPILFVNSTNYGAAEGGAFYLSGDANYNLSNTTIQQNIAQGHAGESITFYDHNGEDGGNAMGGGIYLYLPLGTLTLSNGTDLNQNNAIGGAGGQSDNDNYDLSGKGGDAQGGGVYVQQGSVAVTSADIIGNVTQAGTNGGGQYGVVSADTSNGAVLDPNRAGLSQGGGVYLSSGSLNFSGGVLQANNALGSNVPVYANSYFQSGRTGGSAQGGGLFVDSESAPVIFNSASINGNVAVGGAGGTSSGAGAIGGSGGSASGGALFLSSGSAQFSSSVITGNAVYAGIGGAGDSATAGGNGTADGGGLAANGSLSLTSTIISDNRAWGGPRASLAAAAGTNPSGGITGNGGAGGPAYGGGIYQTAGTLSGNFDVWTLNQAFGGNGGAGYNALGNSNLDGIWGGNGGDGGAAYGGGVYASGAVSISLQNSAFRQNMALGGLGGLGGNGNGQADNFASDGGQGGNGGAGGAAFGGAIASSDLNGGDSAGLAADTFSTSWFIDNQVGGGDGGNGGNSGFGNNGNGDGGNIGNNNYHGGDGAYAGNGGNGGDASGGAVWNDGAALTFSQDAISANGVTSGWGGDGGIGGFGGDGEYNTEPLVGERSDFGGNGGQGGNGGNGGNAFGGGVSDLIGSVHVYSTSVLNNFAVAGFGGDGGEGGEAGYGAPRADSGSGDGSNNFNGGYGGNGGAGGNGGNALGGGIYSGADLAADSLASTLKQAPPSGSVYLLNATISGNSVTSGGHGSGGIGAPTTGTTEQVYASSRAAVAAGTPIPGGIRIGGAAQIDRILSASTQQQSIAAAVQNALHAGDHAIGDTYDIGAASLAAGNAIGAGSTGAGVLEAAALRYVLADALINSESLDDEIEEEGQITANRGLSGAVGAVDDLAEIISEIGDEFSTSSGTALNFLETSIIKGTADLADAAVEAGASLAFEAAPALEAAAEGLVATVLGPESIILAAPAAVVGVYFGVAGAAAGFAALIAELQGGNASDAALAILGDFLQPGQFTGGQIDLGLAFQGTSGTTPVAGAPGSNGSAGSDGTALGGGVYVEPAYDAGIAPVTLTTTIQNTIIAQNSATDRRFTTDGYTDDPTGTKGPFTQIVTVENGQSYSSYPLYPKLQLVSSSDNTDEDVYGTIISNGGNVVGVAGSSTWTSSDQTGSVAAPLNPQLVVVETDPENTSTPLAEVGGSITYGIGNYYTLPSDFPAVDQLGDSRIAQVSGNLVIDAGAVEYTDGPIFTLAGDVSTLSTPQTQTIPSFATLLAPSPADTQLPAAVSYTVSDDSNPSLFSTGPAIAANGTLTYTLAPGATGKAAITVFGTDAGFTSEPQVFSITAASDSTIKVTSTQPAGTVPANLPVEYDVTVDDAATTGALPSGSDVQVQLALPAGFTETTTSGSGWTIAPDASDPSILIATYTLGTSGLAQGAVLPTLALTGTFAAATYAPVLTAFDKLPGNDQLDHDSNLVFENSPAAITFTAGTPGSFTLTTSEAAAFSESATDTLPAGLTFNSATGVLSGTPVAGTGGTYTLNFTASAQPGQTYSQPFTLTVIEPLSLTGLSQSISVYGSGSVTVSLNGTGFNANTVARFDGVALVTHDINGDQATAVIPAADLLSAGSHSITVSDNISGFTSQPLTFTVARATPIVTVAAASGLSVNPVTTVTGINGAAITDGSVTYNFYNSSGTLLAGQPTAPGSYTVRASFSGDADYLPATSSAVAFAITASKTLTTATSQFTVTHDGFVLASKTRTYTQTLTFTNNGPTVTKPLTLVLTNLSSGATLVNASGKTTSADLFVPAGSTYLTLAPTSVAAGASFTVTLQFSATSVPTYGITLLQGTGTL